MQPWILSIFSLHPRLCIQVGYLPAGDTFTSIGEVEVIDSSLEALVEAIQRGARRSMELYHTPHIPADAGAAVADAFGLKGGERAVRKQCGLVQLTFTSGPLVTIGYMRPDRGGWVAETMLRAPVDYNELAKLTLAWFANPD